MVATPFSRSAISFIWAAKLLIISGKAARLPFFNMAEPIRRTPRRLAAGRSWNHRSSECRHGLWAALSTL